MISRKKKLRIAQISLLILGLTILFFTYANKENNSSTQIISKETQERIKKDLAETSEKATYFIILSILELILQEIDIF